MKVGIDIVEIPRIKNSIDKHSDFLTRYFTKAENEMFLTKKINKFQSIAGNFSAKEAFFKAIGTGVANFSFKEIEILRDNNGKPFINCFGKIEKIIKEN
ncbi:MAG: holo-ACP synthase, partial [Oscillospiraceae bacterium]